MLNSNNSHLQPPSSLITQKMTDKEKDLLFSKPLNSILKEATLFLKPFSDTPALDAALLMMNILSQPREYLLRHRDEQISNDYCEQFITLLYRRATHEPVAHIIGSQEFWSLNFTVTKDTLIPRPDSEILIEAALEFFPNQDAPLRILDAGTGTGCLILTLLTLFSNAQGTACDISKGAYETAKKNAKSHHLLERCNIHHQSWEACDGMFDLIISNPPYISQEQMDVLMPDVDNFEPHLALFGGNDGLEAYKSLFHYITSHLAPGGFFICEHGFEQRDMLCQLAESYDLKIIKQYDDLGGNARCLVIQPKT